MSRKQSQFPEKLTMVDGDEFAIYDSENGVPAQQNASVKKLNALPTLPTTDEKAAMTASETPGAANEFITQSALDAVITALGPRLLPETANEGDIIKYTGGAWVASGVLDGGGA